MTHVDCTVSECVYNEEKCCCRNGITVEGDQAKMSDETYCGNYEMRGHTDCCRNSTQEPSKKINITCDVLTCRYNDGRACEAGNIDIITCGSGIAGQTECASFEVK